MFFQSAKEKIQELFDYEQVNGIEKIKDKLFSLLSKFCRYEEEEVKIRPQLFIGEDVLYFLQVIPDKFIYTIEKPTGADEFDKMVKSLIPLSNEGYSMYIDLKGKKIQYGLFKPKDSLTIVLDDIIFGSSYSPEDIQGKSLIKFSYENSSMFSIHGVRGSKETISFNIVEQLEATDGLVEFLSKEYSGDQYIHQIVAFWGEYKKLLKKNVHGCICVFIDGAKKNNTKLKGGIWLKTPICLTNSVKKYKETKDYSDLLDLMNEVELSFSLINNDGITVFDEKGNILAYNVFVESKSRTKNAGGARRRAAEYIVETSPPECRGVYFQSQDGETFFKELIVLIKLYYGKVLTGR